MVLQWFKANRFSIILSSLLLFISLGFPDFMHNWAVVLLMLAIFWGGNSSFNMQIEDVKEEDFAQYSLTKLEQEQFIEAIKSLVLKLEEKRTQKMHKPVSQNSMAEGEVDLL